MIWLDTEYVNRADETIQTVIVGDDRVMYVHFRNGYYSIIEGAMSLYRFLSGDVHVLRECFESEEDVEHYLKQFE